MDTIIGQRFAKYLKVRADKFEILRREPIKVIYLSSIIMIKSYFLKGYDVSFLITNYHMEKFEKEKMIIWICRFMEEI
jgi:actin related protein 2/3 complex subunit 4